MLFCVIEPGVCICTVKRFGLLGIEPYRVSSLSWGTYLDFGIEPEFTQREQVLVFVTDSLTKAAVAKPLFSQGYLAPAILSYKAKLAFGVSVSV